MTLQGSAQIVVVPVLLISQGCSREYNDCVIVEVAKCVNVQTSERERKASEAAA
jgi:hypothetical protein